jgi:hypothetical protein
MQAHFGDGRVLSVPLVWFPILHKARPEQRLRYEIGGGTSLHWPELDEDLSIAGHGGCRSPIRLTWLVRGESVH